jgi:hypothetical protein
MFVPKIQIQEHSTFISYAHFSSSQQLETSDRETINQIASLTDQFVVSTNKPELMDFLHDEKVSIQKRNLGFDLAMHRDVLHALNKSLIWPQYLILTNNSLIWDSPNGFKEQFQECERFSNTSGATIIFMTDSLQPSHHLQSYFIFVNTSDNETQELIYSTFTRCRNWRLKRSAVFFGEKRLLTSLGSMPRTSVMYPIVALWELFTKNRKLLDKHSNLKVEFLNPNQHMVSEMKRMGARFQKKPRLTKRNRYIVYLLERILNHE